MVEPYRVYTSFRFCPKVYPALDYLLRSVNKQKSLLLLLLLLLSSIVNNSPVCITTLRDVHYKIKKEGYLDPPYVRLIGNKVQPEEVFVWVCKYPSLSNKPSITVLRDIPYFFQSTPSVPSVVVLRDLPSNRDTRGPYGGGNRADPCHILCGNSTWCVSHSFDP